MPARRPATLRPAPPADHLIFPDDPVAWQAWQTDRHRVRNLVRRRRNAIPPSGVLTTTGDDPRVLIALDGATPSHEAALVEPARHIDPAQVAVLSPNRLADPPPGAQTRTVSSADELGRALPGMRILVSAGGFLPVSGLAHRAADRIGARVFVVQHGALTPFAPPLPACTLLAWSDADGAFWRSGRTDVNLETVGSQLLWAADEPADPPVDPAETPTFLGQLHGAELPRREVFAISRDFCRATGARYRPHPAERDKLSRLAHRVMRRSGIAVSEDPGPMRSLQTPVVAIFSSGILEAAAAGLPGWAHHPDPPEWITGFWERYGISPWGADPTPPPPRPEVEPAEQIARILTDALAEKP